MVRFTLIGFPFHSDTRAVTNMFSCSEKCFKCPYVDCYNNRYGPDVLDEIIAVEKMAGVYLPQDAALYSEEVFAALVIQQRQRRIKK